MDISAAAIAQLAARAPERADRLVCGDLGALPAAAVYPVVIGIQVFQHGDRAAAHAHIRAAQQHLAPGGLFCLRVNATATDIWPRHDVTGRHPDGGLTVRYLTGPRKGLLIRAASNEPRSLYAEHGALQRPSRPIHLDHTCGLGAVMHHGGRGV